MPQGQRTTLMIRDHETQCSITPKMTEIKTWKLESSVQGPTRVEKSPK